MKVLIMCRSLTTAQRGALLLERRSISVSVVKAPQHLRGNGCGYALSLYWNLPDYLPDRLEAGTHNFPGIAGLDAGMAYVRERGVRAIFETEHTLLCRAVERLSDCAGVELFAGPAGTQSGVLSLRMAGMDADEASQRLTEQGICLRSGLHCAPLAHKSAGTLDTSTLRMSFSPFVRLEEVDACCEKIRELTR